MSKHFTAASRSIDQIHSMKSRARAYALVSGAWIFGTIVYCRDDLTGSIAGDPEAPSPMKVALIAGAIFAVLTAMLVYRLASRDTRKVAALIAASSKIRG